MMAYIAGFGSRKTPPHILREMELIGAWIRENSHTLHSGKAPGADYAFLLGAAENSIEFVPTEGFNKNLNTKGVICVVNNHEDIWPITEKFHPAPKRLSPFAKKLMNRNACIILGRNLKEPVAVAVCYTSDGLDSGGTGQGIRIAKAHNIPVINMFFDEFNNASKVIEKLKIILDSNKLHQ